MYVHVCLSLCIQVPFEWYIKEKLVDFNDDVMSIDIEEGVASTLIEINVIDIHYHVVIYNRVILLSLNNTVEFFNYQ